MHILLLQLDGKIPNLALMRIARHHRDRGDDVILRHAGNTAAIQPRLDDPAPDRVYASAIFDRTRALADEVRETWPGAVVGGTGWDSTVKLADVGITDDGPIDYTDYPRWSASLGFSQRGCRLRCPFCVVPKKEGGISSGRPIAEIWRGDPWPRHVMLLDNDFFGHPEWRARVRELTDGQFRVCLTQGINVRLMDDEAAEALASLDYRDGTFRERRLYTALDNPKDTGRFEAGVGRLIDHGVKGRHILVYMLIGFWPGETSADRIARLKTIRAIGALPYPMPFVRTPELIGFQRWAIGGYDRQIPWTDWVHADYQPRKFRLDLKAQGAPTPRAGGGRSRCQSRRQRRRKPPMTTDEKRQRPCGR